ncbi:MAG TPA: lysozyme inhibitor LprI family protein [Longimicrobium sp.]|jgi:uncharacterized protein YecT (DUF1311 family)|uniref:lysozyme inhibitor LprI family protein n=1 Tax=Longimicrobium sp. TaxID=2029185 RepID=UPI002ED84B73
MIRILGLATLLLLLAPAALHAQDSGWCRDGARTQTELNRCAGTELERADSVLNAVYGQVIAGLDSAEVRTLREAQRAWIGLRDAECELETASSRGGSIHPMLYGMCLSRQTRARTAYLRRLMPGPAAAHEEARFAILQATDALFQAMQERDTVALRTLLHPRAQIVSVADGGVGGRTVEEWIRGLSRTTDVLRERMWDAHVEIDENLATLWAPYDFYLGERFSHCGTDAFQYVREGGAWRLIAVSFTRRTTGCDPAP